MCSPQPLGQKLKENASQGLQSIFKSGGRGQWLHFLRKPQETHDSTYSINATIIREFANICKTLLDQWWKNYKFFFHLFIFFLAQKVSPRSLLMKLQTHFFLNLQRNGTRSMGRNIMPDLTCVDRLDNNCCIGKLVNTPV